jgi:DNA polymerase-3 subunit delta
VSRDLDEVFEEIERGVVAPLYLLWGEEFLVRRGADELRDRLLPKDSRDLCSSLMDGASPREVAQELATLPLFPGRKVVVIRDPEFLAPKKPRGDPLARARDAWRSGRRKEGARRVLALLAKGGWGRAELNFSAGKAPSIEEWRKELNVDLNQGDLAFLQEVAAFCEQEQLSAPEGDVSPILGLITKGVPSGHALIIASSEVDPANPLLKWAREQGHLIERKVAARVKDLNISDLVHETLRQYRKKLGPGAEELLKDRCGGNMRLLRSELEKLALYAEGPMIAAADVDLLVGRSREEEFLELSNALQKRDLRAALRYLADAMGQGMASLQLLGAIASIVRTLLLNQDRLFRLARGKLPRSFDEFKQRLFPKIEEEAAAEQQRIPHPYAVFAGMQAASRYPRGGLLNALRACGDADLALKSSGNGQLVLERLLWSICLDG